MLKLLMLSFLMLSLQTQAQQTPRVTFDLSSSNPLYNEFLSSHNIDYIFISSRDGQTRSVEIHPRNKESVRFVEFYSMSFDGHRYLLKKKYPKFLIPNQTLTMTYIRDIPKLKAQLSTYDIYTTIKKDSVIQTFSHYTINDVKDVADELKRLRPLFKGNLSKLTQKFQDSVKLWKSVKVTDSMLILTATIEKNGSRSKLDLTEGKMSVYSKKVLEFLQREATDWWPRMNEGKKMQSQAEISVRANADKTFKISIW